MIDNDYVFTWINFTALQMTAVASFLYVWVSIQGILYMTHNENRLLVFYYEEKNCTRNKNLPSLLILSNLLEIK